MNLVSTEYYFKVTDFIKEKNTKGGLELIDFLVSQGYDLHEFLLGLLDHFRNLLHTVITGSTSTLETSEDYKQKYLSESKYFSEGDVLRIMKLLSDLEINYKYFNQPRLRFEMVLSQIIRLDKTIYIDSLLKEIEELKKKANLNFANNSVLNSTNKSNNIEKHNGLNLKSLNKNSSNENKISSSNSSNSLKSTSLNTQDQESRNLKLEDIKSKWNDLLNEIMKQNRINLKTTLNNSFLKSFENNILTIVCESDFHSEVVKANKQYLLEKIKIVYKTIFEINPIVNGTPNNSVSNGESFKASEHPMIKLLASELDIEPVL